MLRLLNTSTFKVESFFYGSPPPYATLSHVWGPDEVTFDQLVNDQVPITNHHHPRFSKLRGALQIAAQHGCSYLWVDTVCVDRKSSAELSYHVNGAWNLFSKSSLCISFLNDLPSAPAGDHFGDKIWRECRWFSRAWTLMELLAAPNMKFFGPDWVERGAKSSMRLLGVLSRLTHIDQAILRDSSLLPTVSLGTRMSWAANRQTHRPEDVAYSLLGIFGVNMDILYGEGSERAFARLQEAILLDTEDLSLFAWISQSGDGVLPRGMLALSPAEFGHFISIPPWKDPIHCSGKINTHNNRGLSIQAHFVADGDDLILDLGFLEGDSDRFGVVLKEVDGVFVRSTPGQLIGISPDDTPIRRKVTVKRVLDPKMAALLFKPPRRRLLTPVSPAVAGAIPRKRTPNSKPLRPEPRSGTPFSAPSPMTAHSDSGAYVSMAALRPLTPFHVARKRRNSDAGHTATTSKRSHVDPTEGDGFYLVSDADIGGHSTASDDCDDRLSESEDVWVEKVELAPDHPYSKLKPNLVKAALYQFERWLVEREAASTGTPPSVDKVDNMGLDRDATNDGVGDPIKIEKDMTVPNSASATLDQTLLACPFWKANPSRYPECITGFRRRQMGELRRHVRREHMQPNYCPICFDTFENLSGWRAHVARRSCKERALPLEIEGIRDDQRKLLKKPLREGVPPEHQWYEVWDVMHDGNRQRPATPYVDGQLGRVVELIRHFWDQKGTEIVPGVLERMGEEIISDEDRCLVALHRDVLAGMIESLVSVVPHQPMMEKATPYVTPYVYAGIPGARASILSAIRVTLAHTFMPIRSSQPVRPNHD